MGTPSPNRPTDDQLRRLYVEQRLSAEKIAEQCSVQKITVLRWLRDAGIERRPSRGLANRGIAPPTTAELRSMIETEHLPYQVIGDRYGVQKTAVAAWVRSTNIQRPTAWETRRPGGFPATPPEAELRARSSAGQSMSAIASETGVPVIRITAAFRNYGIAVDRAGWGRDLSCADGHHARSVYELRVDDWLSSHSLGHIVEPGYPWDARFKADFLVGATYVEVWGVEKNERYEQRRARKVAECKRLGLSLIQIEHWHFRNRSRTWLRRLRPLLEVERPDHSLFDIAREDGLS